MPDRPSPDTAHHAVSPLRSLSARLFVWLFATLALATGASAWLAVRAHSRQWSESVQSGALRFSEVIKRSTHYGMLLNRKEDVHQIIRTVAREPGVVGVRVYDKQGTIIYSAEQGEIGEKVDLRAEACVACHDGAAPLRSVPADSRTRVFDGPAGERVLGLINPIRNAPECYTAACHAHPAERTVLGVLDVRMSMAEADRSLAAFRRRAFTAAALTALLAGFVAAALIHALVRRPVRRLIEGIGEVAGGNLSAEVPNERRDEIGQLGDAFNRMTHDLRAARAELTRWSDELEQRLLAKTRELTRTQRQVTHMEKMASMGKLAATVAHELNNPLAGILNYARLVERTLAESASGSPEAAETARYLELIRREAGRCGDIVRNLLLFARRSGGEFALQALNPIVERSLMLVRHHFEMAGIQIVHRPLPGDDGLVCDADQVAQALVALFVNAVEAMPEGGTLTVEATPHAEAIELAVSDTGVGITEDALPHLFEPFYSTKDEGTPGAGLGLSVVYGIVQRHSGEIRIESRVGQGTTFLLRLPRRPSAPAAEEAKETSHVPSIG